MPPEQLGPLAKRVTGKAKKSRKRFLERVSSRTHDWKICSGCLIKVGIAEPAPAPTSEASEPSEDSDETNRNQICRISLKNIKKNNRPDALRELRKRIQSQFEEFFPIQASFYYKNEQTEHGIRPFVGKGFTWGCYVDLDQDSSDSNEVCVELKRSPKPLDACTG